MSKSAQPNLYHKELTERLRSLAERHGQAEIARRTGSTRQNVSRYLRGVRAPLDFGVALARDMRVNPSWLLGIGGATYLGNVTGSTGETAGDLLDLVKAMEEVARMRLGEIVSTPNRRLLHDLNEALGDYSRLSERLDERVRPVLDRLIEDIKVITKTGQYGQALEMLQSARQISRFCRDHARLRQLASADAMLQHTLGNDARALQLQQEVFHGIMALKRNEPEWMRESHNYIAALLSFGRPREALRLANAVLSLMADGAAVDAAALNRILALKGAIRVELGNLREGMADIASAVAGAGDDKYVMASDNLASTLLLAGVHSFQQCLALETAGITLYNRLVVFASWLEDARALRKALELVPTDGVAADGRVVHGRRVLQVLRGRQPEPLDQTPVEGESPVEPFARAMRETQIRRLLGDHKEARALLREANRLLASLDAEFTPPLMVRALHHRNVLELIPEDAAKRGEREQRARAARFFTEHVEAGYAFFKSMADRG